MAIPKEDTRSPCGRRYRQAGRRVAGMAAAGLVLAIATAAANASAAAGPAVPDAARRAELVRLVRQDCGSCHGLTLQGGLGPALLPDAMAGKPAAGLKATILHGRPGTAMPPWQHFLDEAEAEWIVNQLQKGFPVENQGR